MFCIPSNEERIEQLKSELAESDAKTAQLFESYAKSRWDLEDADKKLEQAQAEIARLRAIPRPYEPMGMTAQKLQWNNDVEHYESHLKSNPSDDSKTPPRI